MAKTIGDTYIAIVLDGSGSMSADIETTITGVNEIIDLMKAEKKKLKGKVKVSLVVFRNREGEVIYFNENADKAAHLDNTNYVPSGSTPMYDGIGQAIKLIDGVIKDDDAALVYIFTDGYENSSSIYNKEDINSMTEEREKNGNWTFVFQGIEGLDQLELNFVTNNVMSYSKSVGGRKQAYQETAKGLQSYFVSRSMGETQVSNFYDPDKHKVKNLYDSDKHKFENKKKD
jgi:uncharacterized protein YegL